MDLDFILAMTLWITETLFGFGFMVLGIVHTAVSSTTPAIESMDVTNGCADERWRPNNRSCYLYVREGMSFYQANESCETRGANLVSISSAEENQFVLQYVGNNLPVWIGLFRTTNEPCAGAGCLNWMWLDESQAEYSNWTVSLATTGQCVFMTNQGLWGHNHLCSSTYGYVCEQKRIIPTTTSDLTTIMSMSKMTTSSVPDGCANSNWIPKNQSCYLHMPEGMSFYQANESCETRGANLVSISNDEENQFILQCVGNNLPVWIGLFRTTNEACAGAECLNWMWLDGSQVEYSNWTTSLATMGQCAFMTYQGLWGHSHLCSSTYGYVCEQKRIIPSTTSGPTTLPSTNMMATLSEPVATVDSPVANDVTSTYIGVGVSVVILIISISIGLGVYCTKTRRGEKRDTQTSSGTSKQRSSSTGREEYENCNPDASSGQHSAYENGVQFRTLCGREEEVRTSIDPEHAEENPAYEKVNNYSEVRPEYTCLQVASTADTKVESNALYANVEHQ